MGKVPLQPKPALTLVMQEHLKEKAPDHDTELKKSITAYKWSLLHANNAGLVVPPTVTLELASARQESNQFCVMYVLYYGQKWYVHVVTHYMSLATRTVHGAMVGLSFSFST